MSDARSFPQRWRWFLPPALGVYAAAAALAPTPAGTLVLAAPLAAVPLCYWAILNPWRWIALFFASALLLPPLPFALGNSGPHPSLAFVLLGLLVGALRPGEWRVPMTPLNTALLLFFCILLGSVAEALVYSGSTIALGSLARVALFGVSLYVFFYSAHGPGVDRPDEAFAQARFLFWVAAAAALFACIDFYFQFPAPAGFGPQFIWLRSGVYRRAQGLFYEASTLGNFCAFFLVMIAAALLRRGKRAPVSRWSLVVGGIIFAAALVLSFSRASLLNVLAATAVLIWSRRPRMPLGRFFLVVTGCILVGLLVLWALYPEFTRAYWLRLLISGQYLFSATEGILSGRVASWLSVLGFLADHPWHALFGVGYKTLPYSDYLGHTVITDNMYLSLLAETGIVGVGVMLWLSLEILRAGRRAALSTDPRKSFFGSWIFAFWTGQMVQMFSGDLLTYWRVLPLYLWVLAVAVRHERSVP
jgi:putative inorganic carbon (HCO3(-)) transporter